MIFTTMKRLICFCLIAFCFQLYTIAQIELLYTSDKISFANWSSDVSQYIVDNDISVNIKPYYSNNFYEYNQSLGPGIPLGYKAYDYDTFEIIAALNYTSNNTIRKIEISSTGLSQNVQASFPIPNGYRLSSGYVSQHLFDEDDNLEFYLVWEKENPEYYDNNQYYTQLLKDNGTILLEIKSASTQSFTYHHGIRGENSHRFALYTPYYDETNQLKSLYSLYSCNAPMRTQNIEPIHDTVVVTQHDTFRIKDPNYDLHVGSYPPEYGIGVGSGTFPKDCKVEIGAIPLQGYQFITWTDGVRENPRVVSMQGNRTYTAFFRQAPTTTTSYKDQVPWDILTRFNQIIINGAEGNHVKLFDTAGRCIYSGENHIIPVSVPGIYFLQIGNQPAIKVDIQF